MNRNARWLWAVAAAALLIGCNQEKIETAGTAGSTSSSSASGQSGGSGATTATGSGSSVSATTTTPPSAAQEMTLPGGLKYQDLTVGTGAEATPGRRITVHYTGWLTDGTKFDSSVDRGQPYTLTLGAGEVIQGWDQGIVGMKVGGKRKLTIPHPLAYGPSGRPPVIPPSATLLFDVELLGVQ
jgi:FKBP-type peptidyl-prolyl cis-trans isomerase